MATSQRSTPPGTCHTEFSVENKYTYLDTRPIMNLVAGGGGQSKGKATKQRKAKQARKGKTALQ